MARDPIDALAEVMRIDRHGGTRRPLWSDLDEADREAWRDHARFVGNGMARRGFAIIPAAGAPLPILVELRGTLGLIFDDSPEEAEILAKIDDAIAASGGTKA